MEIYRTLPKELIHRIISYDGSIKYRKGEYVNQNPKNDPRYDMLLQKKQPDKIRCIEELQEYLIEIDFNPKYLMHIQVLPEEIKYIFYRFIANEGRFYTFRKTIT